MSKLMHTQKTQYVNRNTSIKVEKTNTVYLRSILFQCLNTGVWNYIQRLLCVFFFYLHCHFFIANRFHDIFEWQMLPTLFVQLLTILLKRTADRIYQCQWTGYGLPYWSRTNYRQFARYSRTHANFQVIICRRQ